MTARKNKGRIVLGCALCALIVVAGMYPQQSSDVLFMCAHGKDMVQNGLTRWTDVFSMHEGLSFMYQKWLMCLLVYGIEHIGGLLALSVAQYVAAALLGVMLFLFMCKYNGGSPWMNLAVSAISLSLIGNFGHLMFRPHVIACMLLVWEIGVLEEYARGHYAGRIYVFYGKMLLISLGAMWFHSTMWLMVLIPVLPYLCDHRRFTFLWNKLFRGRLLVSDPKHGTGHLLGACAFMLLAVVLNPNGVLEVPYMLGCVGATGDKYEYIGELQPASFVPFTGATAYAFVMLFYAAYLYFHVHKGRGVHLRSLYMIAGAFLMPFMAQRMVVYSEVFFCAGMALMAGSVEPDDRSSRGYLPGELWSVLWISVAVSLAVMQAWVVHGYAKDPYGWTRWATTGTKYYASTEAIYDHDGEGTHIFSVDSNQGSYAIYKGMEPYLDCRAEVYDIELNHKKDVLLEFHDILYDGLFAERDFVDYLQEEYDIDYYVIMKDSGWEPMDRFEEILREDGACVYEDEVSAVYSLIHEW